MLQGFPQPLLLVNHVIGADQFFSHRRPETGGLQHRAGADAFRHRHAVQRWLLLGRYRFAKMLFRQRFKRRQRLIGLCAVSDQADGIAVAHLQERQLVQAARVNALPVFFQQQFGVEGRQDFR